jgi:hypothetical protein
MHKRVLVQLFKALGIFRKPAFSICSESRDPATELCAQHHRKKASIVAVPLILHQVKVTSERFDLRECKRWGDVQDLVASRKETFVAILNAEASANPLGWIRTTRSGAG